MYESKGFASSSSSLWLVHAAMKGAHIALLLPMTSAKGWPSAHAYTCLNRQRSSKVCQDAATCSRTGAEPAPVQGSPLTPAFSLASLNLHRKHQTVNTLLGRAGNFACAPRRSFRPYTVPHPEGPRRSMFRNRQQTRARRPSRARGNRDRYAGHWRLSTGQRFSASLKRPW